MRALALASLLVGCAEPPEVVGLEIGAPSSVQRVELYIAPLSCGDDDRVTHACDTQLAWDTAPRKVDGDTFILDASLVTVATRVGDGQFRIDLKPAPESRGRSIERLLVVGYPDETGAGAPNAATMLQHLELPREPQRWHIELGAVEPMDDTTPTTDVQRLHMWSDEVDSPNRCIVMERWLDGGAKVRRDFLVPFGDTDCDNAPVECDPFWFDAPVPSGPADAVCTVSTPLPGHSGSTCQLGAYTCSEQTTSGQACTPITPLYCLADAMCLDDCFDSGLACINQGLAHIVCDIYTNEQGGECVNDAPAFLGLSELAASPLADCGLPVFGAFAMPFANLTNPGMVGPIRLTATPSANMSMSCAADITWSGMPLMGGKSYGVAKVPLPNGTASILGIVVDVHFNGCNLGQPNACYLVMKDGDSASHCGPLLP